MEATGYSRWFERLAELGFEVWIGDRASGCGQNYVQGFGATHVRKNEQAELAQGCYGEIEFDPRNIRIGLHMWLRKRCQSFLLAGFLSMCFH
jgi:hypothetical protein